MRSDQDLGHCDERLSLLAVASALPSSQHTPSAPCLASHGPCIPSSQGTLSGLCVKPLTGISRQMLAPWEGWAAGRPEAALTSWVIDLGECSPGMPDKPRFPLGWTRCQPDGFEPGAALSELGPTYGILNSDGQSPRNQERAPDLAGGA